MAEWKNLEQLSQRVTVLMTQVGDLTHDIQVATTQGVGEEELSVFAADLRNHYADLVAQVFRLGVELGIVAGEDHETESHDRPSMSDFLDRGVQRMEQRKAEYTTKGWRWI